MQALMAVGIVFAVIIGIFVIWGIMSFLEQHAWGIFGIIFVMLGAVGVVMIINAIMNNNVTEAVVGTILALVVGVTVTLIILMAKFDS